jgi:hypothetical protein
MKVLSYIALLILLAGCAAPYYSVPVSSEGDYYIAERQSGGSYYGGNWYYAYWCPPYRPRLYVQQKPRDKIVASPVMSPPSIVTYPGIDELRRWDDRAMVSHGVTSGDMKYRRSTAWKSGGSARSLPAFGRSASSPGQSSAFTRSSGRSSARSGAARGARAIAGKPYAVHKQ